MKRKLFFVLLGLLLLSPLTLHAKSNPFVEGGIEYKAYENNDLSVIGLADKSLTNIVIPEKRQYPLVVWRNVKDIYNQAFQNEVNIVSITLPNTIKTIFGSAFANCTALASINIPSSVTYIGGYAFENCTALTTLTVPNSVTTINSNAFKDVFNVEYNGSATGAPWGAKHLNAYVEGYIAYESAAKTKIIDCHPAITGKVVIPSSVTEIASYAFDGCTGITQVTIPSSVTRIGDGAFRGCSNLTAINILTATNIPSSAMEIGNWAFARTGISSITIPASVTFVGNEICNGCTALRTVVWNAKNCSSGTSSSSNFFSGVASQITTFTFGSEVEKIPAYLCYGMSALTNITLPASITTIRDNAFNGCSGISSITIPRGVTSIASSAFANCSALTTVVWNAKNCSDASSMMYAPFYKIKSITSFTFGSEVEKIPAYLCYGMEKLTNITLPNSVTTIGGGAFQFCNNISAITIPSKVTGIGDYAFSGCTSLTTITSNATTAPACGSGVFSSVPATIPVNIPCGSLDSYKAATIWKDFTNMTEPYFYAFELQTADAAKGSVQFDKPFTCASKVAYFSAVPAEHYHFTQWSDGNTENPRTLTLTKDMTLTAEFAINQYTLTVLSDNEEQGTVTGGTTADYNTPVEISATAETGYHFMQWSDGNTDNPRIVTVSADSTLTAQFASNQYTLTVLSDNEEQGTATGGTTADYNTTVEITATAATGYHFTQWSDGNTDNPRIVTVSADSTLTAQFAPNQYTLTVLSDNEEQGTATGGKTADYLTEIIITAVPAAGYKFLQWNDDNTDNPRTVTLTEDATYTAFFMKDEATGIGQTTHVLAAEKIIRNGQVLIVRGGKVYTLTGEEVHL